MIDGFVDLIADRQTGPRGDGKVFAQSMAMPMGRRSLGGGTLGLHGMLSLPRVPSTLEGECGGSPRSYMVFMQARLSAGRRRR